MKDVKKGMIPSVRLICNLLFYSITIAVLLLSIFM